LMRFDAVVDRIESEQAWLEEHETHDTPRVRHDGVAPVAATGAVASARRIPGRLMAMGGAGLVAVLLLIGVSIFAFRGGRPAAPPDRETTRTSGPILTDLDELDPGTNRGGDGGNIPYYMRRQVIYYRSVYTAGMILVDRSQRYLYLLQPQSRAVRYGIGVGGECDVAAGLVRIESKSEWPEWTPSAELRKQHNVPARVAGGPDNPLGAYAMYFKDRDPGIHGTNAPRSIGRAVLIGCLRLLNDDVVDLEKRAPVGTSVLVLN